MFRGVTVVAGPAHCGKTTLLLDHFRQELTKQSVGSALWISPTHRNATTIRVQVLSGGLPGCFSPQCLTFSQFAERVLDASPLKTRLINGTLSRQILRRLIDEALTRGQLPYFAPIALTIGFLDLILQFIQELKRLEIWPDELAAAHGKRAGEKERELCYLYTRYQEVLTEYDLYDPQGRFWSARALLRDGQRRPYEQLRHVLVDGFTDFTRTEHEILEVLSQRVDSLTIALPLEQAPRRDDLFAKSAQTLADLRRRHPQIQLIEMPRRKSSWQAMAHLEQHLFANPRHVPPAADTAGIEIVAAAGATQEVEWLARQIKKLLSQGDAANGDALVRPGEIVVIFRSLAETGDLVREVFSQFGIPLALDTLLPLQRAPIMSALATWLRLDLEDWSYRQLLSVLLNNFFRPRWPEWQAGRAVVAAEGLIHALQIPSGRAELLERVERWAKRPVETRAEADDRAESPLRHAQIACPLLQRMARTLDALPRRASAGDWADAITKLAETLGFFETVESAPGFENRAAEDRAAWQQLITALQASDRLARTTSRESEALSRREYFELLSELLRSEPLPLAHDETGRVRVLSAESARNVSAPYVFLAGMAEKAFPPPLREDCLYGEAETQQLVAAGLPLVSSAERSRFEMLLFYEVMTRASRKLVLSYPALDPAAQPLSPSPYLREIEQACGMGHIRKIDASDLSCLPAIEEIVSPRDLRIHAVEQSLQKDTAFLAQLYRRPARRAVAENILSGLQASEARQRGESFGPYEGMLVSPAAHRLLRDRYGPQRCWSPSQLEQYARCPYQFFLASVLHLQPVDEPGLEADYLGRGRMLHWLLSTLHRKLNRRLGGHRSPTEQAPEEFLAEVTDLLRELLTKLECDRPLENSLLQIDARRVAAGLDRYYEQHDKYDQLWRQCEVPLRPAHFEVAFGPSRHGSAAAHDEAEAEDEDPLSTERPFELVCGKETFRFSGRIDRIDLGSIAGQTVFTILDYKSGASSRMRSADAISQGYALQLPLYTMAARDLLAEKQAVPYRAAYWHIAGKGYAEAIQFAVDVDGELEISPEWETLQADLRYRVRALVEGIRGGQFPIVSADDHCTSHCPYNTVCHINQVRSLGKTWEAPREVSP